MAGPRYSPQVNVPLPISRVFSGLGRTDEFYGEFAGLCKEFDKHWGEASFRRDWQSLNLPKNIFRKTERLVDGIVSSLKQINDAVFGSIHFADLNKLCKKTQRNLWKIESKLNKAIESEESKKKSEGPGSRTDRFKHFSYEVRQLNNLIYRTGNIAGSSFTEVSNERALLLLGEAGTGKTHLLCDIAESRLKNNLPTVLILGQQLQSVSDPLEAIIGTLGLNVTKRQFLLRLNNIAKRKRRRILILIDAVNEGDRDGWRRNFSKFLQEIGTYPGIGLALSCRSPFDKITVPKRARLVREYHHGFSEHELNALKTYTSYYKLPLPQIPILTPEFSNPLFLKLFCESLERVVVKKRHKQINEISSGQRGMTNIFEDVVIAKGEKIARQFGLDKKIVWKIIKEDIASKMASEKRGWVHLSEMKNIIGNYVKKQVQQGPFLHAMINENLLSEDVFYSRERNDHYEVVRFPYQKFSDHIVARHLLSKEYFDKNKIKESFHDPARLGWLLLDEHTIYSNAGLLEAIMVELPNRINNGGELFDYLPKEKVSTVLAELFINGLYWRDASCFNKSTDKWVGKILQHDDLRDKLLDVLIALATKPKHPYRVNRLDKYLNNFSMQKRDLVWSEFLRHQEESGTIYKLLSWVESFWKSGINEDYAPAYIGILRWFLTSTNRPFRDRATRSLYYLGRKYPQLLFNGTLDSLKINDPYIPERMLAASYGVAMALHYGSETSNFNNKHLKDFARKIFTLMFTRKAKLSTTHVLMRDYARRIIEISLLHKPDTISHRNQFLIRSPFKFGGIRNWGESEDLDKDKYRNGSAPMHMDFENYTLGRLVPSRSNYDYKHDGYQKVRRNILWRIYQLGYSHDVFKDIDSHIAQYNWNRSEHIKVDRYGKKYCWIAFSELAGFREDKGLLGEKYGARISDIDIDPSFPYKPKEENFVQSDFIGDRSISVEDWIDKGPLPDLRRYLKIGKISGDKGPWVLLDGFFVQEDLEAKRDIFIFARGFFVSEAKKESLIGALKTLEYPGNNRLPEVKDDHYIFAGEIPWCDTFSNCRSMEKIEIPTGEKIIVRKKIKRPKQVLVIGFGDRELRLPGYSEEDLKRGFIEQEQDKVLSFDVELPVRNFSWSDTTSFVNPGLNAYIPTREVCEYLQLSSRPQTFDMYDSNGRAASLTRTFGDLWHSGCKAIYLRKDLLNKYLGDKKKSLVWIVWGERRFRSKDEGDLRKFTETHPHYKVYKKVEVYN